MSTVVNNTLASTLNVFSQDALDQMIASMPSFNLFTRLFDPEIANGGQALITRIPNTTYNTLPSDLTLQNNGVSPWNNESASVSNLKFGGIYSSGIQTRLIRLNEQMVSLLQQMVKNTQYNNQYTQYGLGAKTYSPSGL